MRSFLIALTVTVLALPALSQAGSEEATIRAQRVASNRAISAGNAEAFAASLAPDLVVVTGNGTQLSREAYLNAFAKDFQDPHSTRFERVNDSVDLSGVLPLAAEHGHWIGRAPGGPAMLRGTYLAMWRKTAAGWQIRSELFVVLECTDPAACQAYRHKYAESK
jgi:ketosteroid isomerase-like protein